MQKSRVQFDKDRHVYELDGRYLKGVTGLVETLFPDMYAGVPEAVLQKAAERGKAIHDEIEAYEALGVEGDSPEFFAYKKVKAKHGFSVLESEFLVDNGIYATMCDQVAELDGLCLIDLKTTAVLHLGYLSWQLSITAYLFEYTTSRTVKRLYGLHLRGDKGKLVEVPRVPDSEILKLMLGDISSIEKPVLADDSAVVLLADLEQTIIDLKGQIEQAEAQKKTLQIGLIEEMKKAGLKKVETPRITITYVEPSERATIDSKRLKDEQPEVYAEYSKVSNIKESIRIKLN